MVKGIFTPWCPPAGFSGTIHGVHASLPGTQHGSSNLLDGAPWLLSPHQSGPHSHWSARKKWWGITGREGERWAWYGFADTWPVSKSPLGFWQRQTHFCARGSKEWTLNSSHARQELQVQMAIVLVILFRFVRFNHTRNTNSLLHSKFKMASPMNAAMET